jgi:uncharacterized protein (DUF2126 family)
MVLCVCGHVEKLYEDCGRKKKRLWYGEGRVVSLSKVTPTSGPTRRKPNLLASNVFARDREK